MHKCWGLHEWHVLNLLKGAPFVGWKILIFLKTRLGCILVQCVDLLMLPTEIIL